jgi:hypothetical protein
MWMVRRPLGLSDRAPSRFDGQSVLPDAGAVEPPTADGAVQRHRHGALVSGPAEAGQSRRQVRLGNHLARPNQTHDKPADRHLLKQDIANGGQRPGGDSDAVHGLHAINRAQREADSRLFGCVPCGTPSGRYNFVHP